MLLESLMRTCWLGCCDRGVRTYLCQLCGDSRICSPTIGILTLEQQQQQQEQQQQQQRNGALRQECGIVLSQWLGLCSGKRPCLKTSTTTMQNFN
uniref:Uncharacterized protein n=1 Tax=Vespula pensylvanica TaxID=30213 RepID=A0A834P8H9_VESPE|nr:hypothetical protein H0235_004907 [Vespula pensylvanica]